MKVPILQKKKNGLYKLLTYVSVHDKRGKSSLILEKLENTGSVYWKKHLVTVSN